MADEPNGFADDVKRYEATQKTLTRALEELQSRSGQPFDSEHAALLVDALRATAELRDFLIRDLGTAVANLQNLEGGLNSLGDYVNSQRESLNDLSATLAALVHLLLSQSVVSAEDLARKKAELTAAAPAPASVPAKPDPEVN
jgi:ABC-type transporter Mla subunit MlaD